MATYKAIVQAFGYEPLPLHAASIVLHIVATLLAYLVFLRLIGQIWPAFFAAMLFAAHPAHTEAVAWISALNELGCAVFFLFAFYFYLLADGDARVARRQKVAFWTASSLCFGLALLWKEMALTLPLVIGSYSFLRVNGNKNLWARLARAARVTLPYWVVMAAYMVLRHHALGYLYVTQRDWILSPAQYVLTIIELIAKYWLKLLAPVGLNAYYMFEPVRSLGDARTVLAIGFLVIAVAAILLAVRRAPLAAFAASWIFLTLTPVLNVYGVGRNVFAERYLYTPSLGFCLLIALALTWALKHLPAKRRAPAGVLAAAALLAFYVPQCLARNSVWKDDFTLFSSTLKSSPNTAVAHNVVADVLRSDQNDPAAAEPHYERALALAEAQNPAERRQIAFSCEGLASIYAARGEYERAFAVLDRARAADPDDPDVRIAQGVILAQSGRWREAKRVLQEALADDPNNENVLNTLGVIARQNEHEYQRASNYFHKALQLHPGRDSFRAAVHNNLGGVYGDLQQYQAAIAQFEQAVKFQPNNPEFRTNLATAYMAAGRLADARVQLEAALGIAPDYPPARATLTQYQKLLQSR